MRGAYGKCATHNTGYFVDDLFGASRQLCVAHFEQYAPLVRKLLVEHICKCATNKY
jgi:hypothetical protein